jgi:hypothetical protein
VCGVQSLFAGLSSGRLHHDGACRERLATTNMGRARRRWQRTGRRRASGKSESLMMITATSARKFDRLTWVFILCAVVVSCASVSAWRFDNLPLFLVGLPGDIVMMLMTGVHGGGTYTENLIAGIVCVIVNTIFFYYLFRFIAWLFKRRADHGNSDKERNGG